jgi:hypothetical protein
MYNSTALKPRKKADRRGLIPPEPNQQGCPTLASARPVVNQGSSCLPPPPCGEGRGGGLPSIQRIGGKDLEDTNDHGHPNRCGIVACHCHIHEALVTNRNVIPAKAGTQTPIRKAGSTPAGKTIDPITTCGPSSRRRSGSTQLSEFSRQLAWTPVFAGVTSLSGGRP